MASTPYDIITRRLDRGQPLSAFAVAELRAAEQEGALRANAANVVRALLDGRTPTDAQLHEAERYYPEKVVAWRASLPQPKSEKTGGGIMHSASAPLDNARHERFAQLVAQGRSQADAYREVYPASLKWRDKTVHEQASRLANDRKVHARVADLQAEAASHTVVSARELQERLSAKFRALDEAGRVEEMVKVGALIAKVAGYEAPRNVTLRDGGVTEDYVPRDWRDKSDEELLRAIGAEPTEG